MEDEVVVSHEANIQTNLVTTRLQRCAGRQVLIILYNVVRQITL